jgi:hypothetical protein
MIKRIERAALIGADVDLLAVATAVDLIARAVRREAESAERRHVVMQEQIAAGEIAPEMDLKRTLREAATEWLTSLQKQSRARTTSTRSA